MALLGENGFEFYIFVFAFGLSLMYSVKVYL